MSIKFVFLAIPLALMAVLGLSNCTKFKTEITQKPLAKKNPISYEFEVPVEAVRSTLRAIRDSQFEPFFPNLRMYFKEDNNPFVAPPYVNFDFTKAEFEHDVFLYCWHKPIVKSPVYFVKNESLDYLASFHLHITPIKVSHTLVEVFTHRPEVIAGQTSGFLNPHGPANIYVSVQPTTIEEYKILLKIGDRLGIKGMPDLVEPD